MHNGATTADLQISASKECAPFVLRQPGIESMTFKNSLIALAHKRATLQSAFFPLHTTCFPSGWIIHALDLAALDLRSNNALVAVTI